MKTVTLSVKFDVPNDYDLESSYTNDCIAVQVERILESGEDTPLGHAMLSVGDGSWDVDVESVEIDTPASTNLDDWKWEINPTAKSHKLRDDLGRNRCSITQHKDHTTWHLWDEDGVGSENASDPTLDIALDEIVKALKRQDWID